MTTKQLCKQYKISKQYITQLKNGYKQIIGDKIYYRESQLIEGTHYIWNDGKLIWNNNAMDSFFKNKLKKMQNNENIT